MIELLPCVLTRSLQELPLRRQDLEVIVLVLTKGGIRGPDSGGALPPGCVAFWGRKAADKAIAPAWTVIRAIVAFRIAVADVKYPIERTIEEFGEPDGEMRAVYDGGSLARDLPREDCGGCPFKLDLVLNAICMEAEVSPTILIVDLQRLRLMVEVDHVGRVTG